MAPRQSTTTGTDGTVTATDRGADLVVDLAEDRLTTWVPDALGEGDFGAIASDPGIAVPPLKACWLSVPRPAKPSVSVVCLPWSALVQLHLATDGMREVVDERLAPGVCGYRRGAERGSDYSTEYLRFEAITRGEAEAGAAVVYADIRRFFAHVPWQMVRDTVSNLPVSTVDLVAWSCDAEAAGLTSLPSGYGDSRLLANLVLSGIDDEIEVPFVRWIDDYRLFVKRGDDPAKHLARLVLSLSRSGFHLADEKVQITKGSAGRDELASVYHPGVDSPDETRAALRSVWMSSAIDPIGKRRELRFGLRRLAEQRDDIAVNFAISQMQSLPWEAPRLCAYLAEFVEDKPVQERVIELLMTALDADDHWLLARLLPLACRVAPGAVDERSQQRTLCRLPSLADCAPVWALALRFLGLQRCSGVVKMTESAEVPDARAALAVRADLGLSLSVPAAEFEPLTTLYLETRGVAPLPRVDTLL